MQTNLNDHDCEGAAVGNDDGSETVNSSGDAQIAAALINVTPRLIDRETQEQPSGDVELETDRSINIITDRQRRRPKYCMDSTRDSD